MDNSTITYKITTSGIEEAEAKFNRLGATIKNVTINQNGSVTASGRLTKEQAALAQATNNVANATDRATKSQSNYIAHIAKTTVLSAAVNQAFIGIAESAGDAVRQVDLFSTFPASMAALGLSTRDASESLIKLRDYATETGVNLTEAASTVTRFAEVTKDVKAATAQYIGVKNALIAGGSATLTQAQSLEQLTQAYSRGQPQLIEYKSLLVSMPAQLTAVAKAFNQPSAQALGDELTNGRISMQDFMTELTKLSTGTGEIAKQARARMSGIEFSYNVLKNTLTNGIAQIIQAFGRENIVSFLQFLTQVIITTSKYVVIFINLMISLFNIISRVFGGPQIAHFQGDAAAAADSLGDGAGNAHDMADGLGDANDEAKKLNKGLASFDKMNVLADKTSGKDKDSKLKGQNGIDPATAATLGGIFDGLNANMQEVSKWAKIFAGILGGLAANALIAKLFGFNPLKSLISNLADAGKGALGLGKNLEDAGKKADDAGEKSAKSFGTKFGTALRESVPKLGTAIAGFAGGVAGAIGAALGPPLIALGGTIATAIGGALAAGAAVLGVSVGVFVAIIAAVVLAIIGIIYLIYKNWDTIVNFMKAVWEGFVGFIKAVWDTLYDIFAGPIKFLLQFIQATSILIIAIIATLLELIFKLVAGSIVLLYNVLSAIAGWIYNNVIKPVADFFVALWGGVVTAARVAWDFIYKGILAPIGSWINSNVIQPVINFFKGLWNTVSGFVGGFVSSAFSFLSPFVSWIYNNVISPIANLFSGLWNGIKTGLEGMFNGLRNIFGSLGGVVKAPINGVIDIINTLLQSLNRSVKIPDWVPSLGGKSVNFPSIPRLAKGGVVNQATMAIVGESGSEAVMPLENNTEWIDTLADKLNSRQNTGESVQLVVQIGEDKIVNKVVDLINEKTNMSGRNVIYV